MPKYINLEKVNIVDPLIHFQSTIIKIAELETG